MRQEIPHNQRGQLMLIAANCKGKAALEDGVVGRIARVLEGAGREEGVVGGVERDGAEFFPVADHGLFGEDLVECDFALVRSVYYVTDADGIPRGPNRAKRG